MTPNYFLAIESYANFEFDKRNKFSFFGITKVHIKKASSAKKGDLIVIYVPRPIAAFTDVRKVTADGVYEERRGRDYDRPLSFALKTEP